METLQTSPPQTVDSVIANIEISAGVVLDTPQRQLAGAVADFLRVASAQGSAHSDQPTGFFVYGPPGRGKTWLMTKLFEAAPFTAGSKRHVHFHDFFRAMQQRLEPTRSTRQAIETTLTELLMDTEVFFFDELHVHDPGSAALLNRLLAEIVERGIPTLITSNYEPDGLLPDLLVHHVIEPSIKLLSNHFDVRRLDGGTDYRTQQPMSASGFASGRWLIAGSGQSTEHVLEQAGLTPPTEEEAITVLEGHRALRARAVRNTQIWFDFHDLLEARSTTDDFLDLADQFDSWVLLEVPALSAADPAARQRLVTLIDVLVERDFPLTVCAGVARDEFADLPDPPPDLSRTQSRVALLSSQDG